MLKLHEFICNRLFMSFNIYMHINKSFLCRGEWVMGVGLVVTNRYVGFSSNDLFAAFIQLL